MKREKEKQMSRKQTIVHQILAMFLVVSLVLSNLSITSMEVSAETGDSTSVTDTWDSTTDTSWYNSGDEKISYEISTAEQLAGLAELVNAETNSVNFSGVTITLTANIDLNGEAWIPIGTYTDMSNNTPFAGTFDGDGHTISGISTSASDSYQGLFGYVSGATIQNVGIIESNISGGSYVGGVVGRAMNASTVSNCYNEGTVSGTSNVGGVVGSIESTNTSAGTVSDCYNTGAVSGTSNQVGGIAGSIKYITVSNCYNTGTVEGASNVGGIVGVTIQTVIVSDCYNTGTVKGSSVVGGVVGNCASYGAVNYCYNTGTVEGSSYSVGGVAGNCASYGTVNYCYNTGTVESSSYYVGGVVGQCSGGTVTYCYYNSDKCAYSAIGSGDYAPTNVGLTTAQMTGTTDGDSVSNTTDRAQDIMSGFSDTNDWNFTSDELIVSEDGSTTTTYYYYPTLISNTQEPAPSVAVEVNATEPTFEANQDLSNSEVTYTYKATTAALSVTVDNVDSDTLSYKWYSSTDDTDGSWSKIESATTATYTPSSDALGTTYYKVEVTNTITDNGDGGTKTATTTSAVAAITIIKVDPAITDASTSVTGNTEVTISDEMKEQLINELFTEEEIALNVEKNVEIKVDIVSIDDMDEDAQAKFDTYLEEYNTGLEDSTTATQALIFDIAVIRSLAGVEENITELDKPITITISIPEEYQVDGREFFILRNHEGEITVLDDLDDDPTTITISTDCFSNYTLNYAEVDATTPESEDGDEDGTTTEDEEITTVPDTGDHNMPQMLLALMLVSLIGVVIISKKRAVK